MRLAASLLLILIATPCAGSGPAAPRSGSQIFETISDLKGSIDDGGYAHVLRVTVLRTGNPFFVQDRTGGMEVSTPLQTPALRIGDQLILTGRFENARYSPRMVASAIRVVAAGVPPPPFSVTPAMLASGTYDRNFVETEGILDSLVQDSSSLRLTLLGGGERFDVTFPMPASPVLVQRLRTESTLRVRGICLMNPPGEEQLVPFLIAIRSPEDIRVIAAPPFWNREHIAELVGLTLLFVTAVAVAYSQVQQWRFRTVLNERTRLAHDLHDTLAQSFAGIAFQLQAVRNSSRGDGAGLDSHIDLAVSMVAHSHEDARRSIAMLRPADLEPGSILGNLRQQGEALTRGGQIRFTLSASGPQELIPRPHETTLLRIGHEAITNAIRHSMANTISMTLDVSPVSVTLTVADDGAGFDPHALRQMGFGIRAMHARAHSQGGSLDILSNPGKGTSVRVSLPIKTRSPLFKRALSVVKEDV